MDSNNKLKPWNNKKLKIYNIAFNQDKTLLVLATSKGYKIFETDTYTSVQYEEEFQDVLGPLKQAMTLYSSHIIIFFGTKENEAYLNNQIIVWDDAINRKIGQIFLKESVSNFHLSRRLLIVICSAKALIFELKTFKFITAIDKINCNSKLFAFCNNDICAYNTWKNKKQVIVHRFYFDKQTYLIKGQKKMLLYTSFIDLQNVVLSDSGNRLMITSIFGNKLHIYNSNNFQLEFCLFLGTKISAIDNLQFDSVSENKILFIYDQKNLYIYSTKLNEEDLKCHCDTYSDDEILNNKSSLSIKGFFSYWLGEVTHYVNIY